MKRFENWQTLSYWFQIIAVCCIGHSSESNLQIITQEKVQKLLPKCVLMSLLHPEIAQVFEMLTYEKQRFTNNP